MRVTVRSADENRVVDMRFGNGMLVFVLIMIVLQLWLLTATMNAWLGGDESIVWPGLAVSTGAFALNAGLFVYLRRIERARTDGT